MQFQISFPIAKQAKQIAYPGKITLIGSCFTENMAKRLEDRKWQTLQNPHGILFNPVSVHTCIRDVVRKQVYTQDHLFYLNEMWHSWLHHSRFSGVTPEDALQKMNASIAEANAFFKSSNWLVITLGSAFAYRHNDLDMHVSNNHRAPAQWFTKELLDTNFIIAQMQSSIAMLKEFNPALQIIFTISPVRHLRDGVIDNNRSKSRLIEAVHQLVNANDHCYYFPSYEIVIDELRDYRFFDIDFAHPNYSATEYVWERFKEIAIDEKCYERMEEIYKIKLAIHHKTQNPASNAHQQFLQTYLDKCVLLEKNYPFFNLTAEKEFFTKK